MKAAIVARRAFIEDEKRIASATHVIIRDYVYSTKGMGVKGSKLAARQKAEGEQAESEG